MAERVTIQELEKLPRWAIVAFAARCARRVLPLFPRGNEYREAVDRACTIAEQSAASADTADTADTAVAAIAATAVGHTAIASARTAMAAARAARTAMAAIAADTTVDAVIPVASATARAARTADEVAADAADAAAAKDPAYAASRRDYELLLAAAERESWTDETPVPPEFFGPIWPDGEPERWAEAVEQAQAVKTVEDDDGRAKIYDSMVKGENTLEAGTPVSFEELTNEMEALASPELHIYVDRGDATQDDVQDVFDALTDLNIACGGFGLKFVNDGHSIRLVPEEVGR